MPPIDWSVDPETLLAILLMAGVTYLCRAGGYALFRQMDPGPRLRSALAYLPGALFVAYVVPALVQSGPKEWVGALVTVVVMFTTRNLIAGILLGTGAATAVWWLT
ncbi:AzlD family protein [Lacibacterium aquatile]|uniref:AzlD family protein n=1 Tax=Lacibacterium aquatile TaxID=1168082 RepID=A0ABW5DTX7_9PROT